MNENTEKKIRLEVLGLTNASRPEFYALILAENGGMDRRIPIIIGLPEAQSIAVRIQGLHSPRPLSHDIFMTMALSFKIEMVEALIYKLQNGIFYSQIVCRQDDKIAYIDSRTSDAVALALRFNAPIYTYNSVLDEALIRIQNLQVAFDGVDMSQYSQESPINERQGANTDQLIDMDRTDLEQLPSDKLHQLMERAIVLEKYEEAGLIRDILKQRNE
ncbi:MAG: bifunctional nuclease family protein [Bacteroidales bacterium]|nr:bifunctional nuclease family protein [Bacteroidales bacterium]